MMSEEIDRQKENVLGDYRELQQKAWKSFVVGCCAALSFESIAGFVEFIKQSMSFLAPLNLNWPGLLDPSVQGAVIVQTPNGDSFLRAYGTLPHPNILGGFAFVLLLGPIALFLRKEKPNHLALFLITLGISLLALTFSRSAWLALIAFGLILVWKLRYFDRKRLVLLLVVGILSFVLTLLPYRQLVQSRTTDTTSTSEQFSFIGRLWLNHEALQMIGERPFAGVGIGSFIIELSRRAGVGYIVEPVHNLLLLAGAELGIPGLLVVVGVFASLAYSLFNAHDPNAILVGAITIGLAAIGLFDHYLWTLAPGRLMLGSVLGLFFGQVNRRGQPTDSLANTHEIILDASR